MSYNEALQELMDNVADDVRKRNPEVFGSLQNSTSKGLEGEAKTGAENIRSKPSKYHNQRRQPEKNLEQFVHDTAKACGLLYYHTYRSRYSEPGFPDCIIIGQIVLVVELKATGKHPTALQQTWLDAFESVGITTKVWHPEDKEIIMLTLKNIRHFKDYLTVI